MIFLNKYLLIICGALVTFFAFGVYMYSEGKNACEVKNLKIVVKETTTAIKDREDAKKQVRNTDDIDSLLTKRGIMRNVSNR